MENRLLLLYAPWFMFHSVASCGVLILITNPVSGPSHYAAGCSQLVSGPLCCKRRCCPFPLGSTPSENTLLALVGGPEDLAALAASAPPELARLLDTMITPTPPDRLKLL